MSLPSKPEARAEGMGFGVQQRGFPQLALRASQQGVEAGSVLLVCWAEPMSLPSKPEARAEGMGCGGSNADSLSLRFGLRSRGGCWVSFAGMKSGTHVLGTAGSPGLKGPTDSLSG